MGCICAKNSSTTKIIKENKLKDFRINLHTIKVINKHSIVNDKLRFFSIKRKDWVTILNFLNYKDLCQAGQLNKFLNTVARSQHVLKKFFQNKRISNKMGNNSTFGDFRRTYSCLPTDTGANNNQYATNYQINSINNNNTKLDQLPVKSNLFVNKNDYIKSTNEKENFDKNSITKYMSSLNINPFENSKINFKRSNDSPISNISKTRNMISNVPTFKNTEMEVDGSINLSCTSVSNFSSNSYIARDNIEKSSSYFLNNEVKLNITTVGNDPYLDIFSKKEIDFRFNKPGSKIQVDPEESLETYKLYSNRKYSIDELSDNTPSFSQEVLMTLHNQGKLSITNITRINFSVNKSSTSSGKEINNYTSTGYQVSKDFNYNNILRVAKKDTPD